MAERSTAAVGVANESGEKKPLADRTDGATADEKTDRSAAQDAQQSTPEETSPAKAAPPKTPPPAKTPEPPEPPELHSGHKLARRYCLEECVTRLDGFSSWKAVDEKLRRAVGIHILPAGHSRARRVLAAARSAALLGDPRFVQVLDAVEENDLVYVIHEWLPDATSLTALLGSGPLEPHDAYQLVSQISQAMAAAHREGLAHLRLHPGSVLRTESGQYRIRGLAVTAALRGLESERPQREDTEATGALLYAAITQRWPYPEDVYGLTGLPKDVGLIAPDQVRAGVHRGLSELAMRALVNEGATASRQEPPCTTPEELAKAVAAMPKIRPPEPTLSQYQRTTFQQGSYRQPATRPVPAYPGPAPMNAALPPALPGRTGKVLKWSVSALLVTALGLGSWQVAETLNRGSGTKQTGDDGSGASASASPAPTKSSEAAKILAIKDGAEYYPDGSPQDADKVGLSYDGKPSTEWRSRYFVAGPVLAPYKEGVGIIYDLGSEQTVSDAKIDLLYPGDHTSVALYAADSLDTSASLSGMTKLSSTSTRSTGAELSVKGAKKARYVLVWITAAPYSAQDGPYGAGYKQAITEVTFKG